MSSAPIYFRTPEVINPPSEYMNCEVIGFSNDLRCSRNINANFKEFIERLIHIPDRVKDLIEIATYVFAVDRIVPRGPYDAVEYQKWSRKIALAICVRDVEFWNQKPIKEQLSKMLVFMTGDKEWNFHFEGGHKTDQFGLFDIQDNGIVQIENDPCVILFSGGADSLAGVLDLLETTSKKLILLSHQSSTKAMRTQRQLIKTIDQKYPNRVLHYQFECNLKGGRPAEESQRTRSFLFLSIAYAISCSINKYEIFVFENGITSLNLRRREELMNARASRTTHPKTVHNIEVFLSMFSNNQVYIKLPFISKTKSDVFQLISKYYRELIPSTVSCTSSFEKVLTTHCGRCFQCIDRRLAIYAANLQKYEQSSIYTFDIAKDVMEGITRTIAIDYVRQALEFYSSGPDYLFEEYATDLADIIEYYPIGNTETEKIEAIWSLYNRHANCIRGALISIRLENDDPFEPTPLKGSLLSIVDEREYLKPTVKRLMEEIIEILKVVGEMFVTERPKNENDLNTKIGTFLRSHDKKFRSEYPTVSFACAKVIPDHEWLTKDLLIEAKYIRTNTTPSVITEGIAADLTKYPGDKAILFVIYDPTHKIISDDIFTTDIEGKGRNRVLIIR
jgi:7-cyano-7-deazaguanine synthase in queuosine biosynthesis